MTDEEKTQTADLIHSVFGKDLGRTLDVGCGTGWPIDAGLVDAVKYVGVDPSTGMLNALVANHPHLAGVHPMTMADALECQVLCGTRFDTVLALGGTGWDLRRPEIFGMWRHSKGPMLLMDQAEPFGEGPDLATRVEYELLRRQVDATLSMHRVGRFVATVIK